MISIGLHCLTVCVLHCTTLFVTALHCSSLHYTVRHCTTLFVTALHCSSLHCTVLHCTALFVTALHIVLFSREQYEGGRDYYHAVAVVKKGSLTGVHR